MLINLQFRRIHHRSLHEYRKLKESGLKFEDGIFIVMEMNSEDIFSGDDLTDVIRKAEKKYPAPYPERLLHGIEVGYDGCFLLEFE